MKSKIHPRFRPAFKSVLTAAPTAAIHPLRSMDADQRRDYLDKLLKTLPDAPAFTQWLKTSGEFPPDFDALPRMDHLPDPLRF